MCFTVALNAAGASAVTTVIHTGFNYDLLLRILPIVLSIIFFLYGVFKVESFLKTYKAKKLDATFNFYTNLDMLIRRLYLSISYYEDEPEQREDFKKGEPSLLLRYIWGEGSGEGLEGNILLLTRVVTDFLSFISTSREQIPPGITEEVLSEWNRQKSNLVSFLNALMPSNPHESPGYNDSELEEEHEKLIDILDYFMNMIEDAYEEYVAKADQSILLRLKALRMKVGTTAALTYSTSLVNAFNKLTTWKSSNTKVVTVDAYGSLTAVGSGSATVTITMATRKKRKKSVSCKVTVT